LKTLILKPSSLGDVVQALPVLRLLKAHNPRNEVYWWIAAGLRAVLEHDPDLSGLFLFQRRGWARPHYWSELLRTLRAVRSCHFDWVIDLQGLARSSLFSWLAQGRLSVGLEDWREGAPGLYDVAAPRPAFQTHAVDWYLQTLNILDVPVHWNFVWIPARPDVLSAMRVKWNIGLARWLAINPGGRWMNKRWPAPAFAETVRRLAGLYPDMRFAILGSETDRELGETIAQADRRRCLDLTGRTSLPELIEWLRLSELVLTNDTGPMHIAAALGKPVVSLFGPTDPHRTGPYRQLGGVLRAAVPCAPCLRSRCAHPRPLECLRAISPESVCAKIGQLLPVE
jgi:lipopolysaccharide heptosyltransferase II